NVKVSTIFPGLIDTGMFAGMKHQFDYITPKLSPERVSQLMLAVLDSQRSQERYLPFYARWTPLLRLLPVEISDWVHNATGANTDLASRTHSASQVKLLERDDPQNGSLEAPSAVRKSSRRKATRS
ncbi:hypothetical protein HDU91_003600, partial [Kappamyces sp. JEL0680]